MEESSRRSVIDASFMLNYIFPDERIDKVQKVFDTFKTGKLRLLSTPLLPYEMVNGIHAAVRTRRITQPLAKRFVRDFLELPIELITVDFVKVFEYATRYNLSVYDASYVTLARVQRLSLLTLDVRMQQLA